MEARNNTYLTMISESNQVAATRQYRPGFQEISQSRTIFIGGIPLSSSEELITDYLAQFCTVESVLIPRDLISGKPKGFAKAVLMSSKGVERILSISHHVIDGLPVGISLWKDTSDLFKEKERTENKKLYVKYQPETPTLAIQEYFSRYGPIKAIEHKRDINTNVNRYFCYITYETMDSALAALHRRVHRVKGTLVVCELSKPPHNSKQNRLASETKNYNDHNLGTQAQVEHGYPDWVYPAPHYDQVLHRSTKLTSEAFTGSSNKDLDSSSRLNNCCGYKDREEVYHIARSGESMHHHSQSSRPKPRPETAPADNLVERKYSEFTAPDLVKKLDYSAKPTSSNYPRFSSFQVASNHSNLSNIRFTVEKV